MGDATIRDGIRKIAGTFNRDEWSVIACSVNSVNESQRTCNCRSIEGSGIIDIPNIQLMAEVDDGILVIPAVGSTVLVMCSNRSPSFVLMYSEVDKILMISGSSVLSIKDGTVQFNDGSLGGLVKVKDLTKKLNNLENIVNDLISKFNSHTHILTLSSGTGTAAPTATPEAKTLVTTQQSDLENTTIKQGV